MSFPPYDFPTEIATGASDTDLIEHDKSAAFAVAMAINTLNEAIELCAKRRLRVEVSSRTFYQIGAADREVYSATVLKVLQP